ncbi:probable RNA-binding protein 46 [Stegodyphus dumicola]|uniref:probable RNA-binding protein 46 n=1 Tax=Stegodyphus dumicola TaxID=202533 RepID=UPI0015AD0BA9|nr:probable RNA-binding protein 46 [Stegodyphus dumicola]
MTKKRKYDEGQLQNLRSSDFEREVFGKLVLNFFPRIGLNPVDSIMIKAKFRSTEIATLYARNIPGCIQEEQLSNLFSLNGTLTIKKVKKLNDFAFIHFYTRCDAEIALERINGVNLAGCIIEVTWAKPVLQNNKKRKSESVVHLKEAISGSLAQLPHNEFISAGESHLAKSPIQLLSHICFENGWGNPIFRILSVENASTQDGAVFVSLVVIPNYPHAVKHFISNTKFLSPIEAKRHAAEIALRNIKCLGDRTGRYIIPLEEMPVTHVDNLIGRGVPMSGPHHGCNDSFSCNIYENSVTEILPSGDPLNLLSMAISLAKFELQTKVCSVPNQTNELL